MLRKIVSVCLTLILVFAFTACKQSGGNNAGGPWEPAENIQFVCQSGAGGGSDLMARAIASNMSQLGIIAKPIVVENITGSGGVKCFTHTQSKDGDPYVWQTVNSNFFVAPISGNIDKNYEDYTTLAVIGTDPSIMCTAADSPFNTLEDVIAACKADPMGVSIMIGSAGSSGHVSSIILENAAGIQMTQVPFDGGGDGLAAVMGKQVDLSWQNIGEVIGPVQSGLLKVIAVASEERSPGLPDVPTFKESGCDVVYAVPRAVVAPPNIPVEALEFYKAAFEKLNSDETWQKNYIETNYITPDFATGDAAVAILKSTHDQTLEVFEGLGLANPTY